MIARRALLSGAPLSLGAAALSTAGVAEAQQALPAGGYRDDQLRAWGFKMADDLPNPTVGSEAAFQDEISTAFKILHDMPKGVDHMTIARYFADLQVRNAACELYNHDWKGKRANPLLTYFMTLTFTVPYRGDHTPWCAAFVSFCLYAGEMVSKFSPSALSYAKYPSRKTLEPKPGDIVVFRDLRRAGGGHVSFFDGWVMDARGRRTERFHALGGNQGGVQNSRGVMPRLYSTGTTGSLEFIGFWPPIAREAADFEACRHG